MSDDGFHAKTQGNPPVPARNDAARMENVTAVQDATNRGRSEDVSRSDDHEIPLEPQIGETQQRLDDDSSIYPLAEVGALPYDVEETFRRLREVVHFHPVPLRLFDNHATMTTAPAQFAPVPTPLASPFPHPPYSLLYGSEFLSTSKLWGPYRYNSGRRTMSQISPSQAPPASYEGPSFRSPHDGRHSISSQKPWLSSGSQLHASPSSLPASLGSRHAPLPPEGAYELPSAPPRPSTPLPMNKTQDISQSQYPERTLTPEMSSYASHKRPPFPPNTMPVHLHSTPLGYTSPWIHTATALGPSPNFSPHQHLQGVQTPGSSSAWAEQAPMQRITTADNNLAPITGGSFPPQLQSRDTTADSSEVSPSQIPNPFTSTSKARRQSTTFNASPAGAPWLNPVHDRERGTEYRPSYIPQDPFHRKEMRKGSGRQHSFTFSGTSNDQEQLSHKQSTLNLRHVLSNPFKSAMQISPFTGLYTSTNSPEVRPAATTSLHGPNDESPFRQPPEIPNTAGRSNSGTETPNMSDNASETIPRAPSEPKSELSQTSDSPSPTDYTTAEGGMVKTRLFYPRPDVENQLPGDDFENGPQYSNQWRRRTAKLFWMIASHRANRELVASRFVASRSHEKGSDSGSSEETMTVSDSSDSIGSFLDIPAVVAHRWFTALYLTLFLFLPSFYFLRVSRLFVEADLAVPMIEQMAIRTSHQWQNYFEGENIPKEHEVFRPQWTKLDTTWNQLIDSLLREWQTLNIISALLLSAILTILQIEDASNDFVTRYTALVSFMCSLFSLLFGCIYIIRFGTMRKTHKAAEWALAAQESTTSTWWNVFVLLALPATFLTWSIVVYIACIMSYIWRTTPSSSSDPIALSDLTILKIRIGLTLLLAIGIVYTTLIVTTFRKYGSAMDETWAERIENWRVQEVAKRKFDNSWRFGPLNLDTPQDHLHTPEHANVSIPTGVGEVFYALPTSNFVPPSPPSITNSDTLHDSEHEPVGLIDNASYHLPTSRITPPAYSSSSHLGISNFGSSSSGSPLLTSLSTRPSNNRLYTDSDTQFGVRSQTTPVTQAAEDAVDVQSHTSGPLAEASSTQLQSSQTMSLSMLDSELLQPPGFLFKRDFSPPPPHESTEGNWDPQSRLDPIPLISPVASVIGTSHVNTLHGSNPTEEIGPMHSSNIGPRGVRFLREPRVIDPVPDPEGSESQRTNSGTSDSLGKIRK